MFAAFLPALQLLLALIAACVAAAAAAAGRTRVMPRML
jgi:hypothetical protein